MAAGDSRSALIWVFRRPLARRGRLAALFGASLASALFGGVSLTSVYPVLLILFDPGWRERLGALASEAWSPLRPPLEWLAAWLATMAPFQALILVLGLLLTVLMLAALAQLAQDWLAAPLVHETVQEIATEAHDALLQGAAADVAQGDLLSRFTADLGAMRIALQKVLGKVLHEPFKLVFLLALLVAIDGQLALLMGVLFPVAAGFVLFLSRRLRDTARTTLAQTGALVSVVEEGLRGRRVVRAFGLEERERRRFLEAQDGLTKNLVKLDRHESLSNPLLELLVGIAAAACVLLGAHRVLQKGDLEPAALITFFTLVASMLDPMRKLADTQVRTQRGAAAAARLRELIASVPAEPPVRGTRPFPGLRQGIALERVGVRASGREGAASLLESIDLAAQPGEVVLVAGRSGAGKSTLLDVIAGLRSYDSGAVRLDGARLEDLSAEEFRARVGLVTQETFLFRGPIAENVTLGRPPRGVSLDEALARAGVDALVASLPDGAATTVESRQFSAGERQRLSIARALYRDPAILLLDEATSALDRPIEAAILREVLAARAGRVTFLVTHRLAPELPVDQVVVLDGGRVVAQGRPREVFEGSPLFRELVHGGAGS